MGGLYLGGLIFEWKNALLIWGVLYLEELIQWGFIHGILYCNKIKKTTFADIDLHYFTSFIFKQFTILLKKVTLQKKVL